MTPFFKVPDDPGPNCPRSVRLVVEIPKKSINKYEYDSELKLFKLSRVLYSPLHYPGDYGFIPGTIAEDSEPLDVLALVTNPSFTGCVYTVRPVGVLDMIDENEPAHKILVVPVGDPRRKSIDDIQHVAEHVRREIEHFFEIYKELEEKKSHIEGWRNAEAACDVITESRARHLAQKPGLSASRGAS
jgi:inorganic pyrophosphatase